MRTWQLGDNQPLAMRLAADARLTRVDYHDDQAWEARLGKANEAVLRLQTTYSRRVSSVAFSPSIICNGQLLESASSYASAPLLTAFAPSYLHFEAQPTAGLRCRYEFWAMESRVVGGTIYLENNGSTPLTLRLALRAEVIRDAERPDRKAEMSLLTLNDGSEALYLGKLTGSLHPVVMLERATPLKQSANVRMASAKLSADCNLAPGETAAFKFVCASQAMLNDSLTAAHAWLNNPNWEQAQSNLKQLATQLPQVSTGNEDWDAVLAFGLNTLLRGLLSPTEALPNSSLVTTRTPDFGFSSGGDGRDYGWQWAGLTALQGYLYAPSLALVEAKLGQGLVLNALTKLTDDGRPDLRAGLAGQRVGAASAPLWAATAWQVYLFSGQNKAADAFLEAVWPLLHKAYEAWFSPASDVDGDGFPVWAGAGQAGYSRHLLSAKMAAWLQGVDLTQVEAPDLAAYLLNEGRALHNMAEKLGQTEAQQAIDARLEKLRTALAQAWDARGYYGYRDALTHSTPSGQIIFAGKGDTALNSVTPITPPNRLRLRVLGGQAMPSKITVVIEGRDAAGKACSERLPSTVFTEYRGSSDAFSAHHYSQVEQIRFEGLIGLFKVEVSTLNLQHESLYQYLPLWAGEMGDSAQRKQLVDSLEANHLTIAGFATDVALEPANVWVWPAWNALLLEGLRNAGETALAATLTERLLNALANSLRKDQGFRDSYNADPNLAGQGDLDSLEGTLPLALFLQVVGVLPVDDRHCWAGGLYPLATPTTITLQGLQITRQANQTEVVFASGGRAVVDGAWQLITDPTPVPAALPAPVALETSPADAVPEGAVIEPVPAESVIPVDSKKDETVEIPISKIDFVASKSNPQVTIHPPREGEDS
jgi:hypothetical protein